MGEIGGEVTRKRGRGVGLPLETLLDLKRELGKFSEGDSIKNPRIKIRIAKIADHLSIDKRTAERYFAKPALLAKEISRHDKEKRWHNELRWRVFFEGMRLFSLPVPDLVNCMKRYVPDLAEVFIDDGTKRLASLSTIYNRTLECFDVDSTSRTVRDRKADNALQERVKANLRAWAPGTIGVHTISILWQVDHSGDNAFNSNFKEIGGRLDVMVLVERSQQPHMAFSPLPSNVTPRDIAADITSFLGDITGPEKVVRLVVGKTADGYAPTTISREALQSCLGDLARVEEDCPTRGIKGDSVLTNDLADAFRLPGRFKTAEDAYNYLLSLMERGYRAAKKPGRVG